jgi:hypothetical protein
MKTATLIIAASLSLSSLAFADTAPTAPTPPPTTTVPIPVPTLKLAIQCVDPAASGIDYAIVTKKTQFTGTVRIRATVKNVGNAPYLSRPEQQVAQLYENRPGVAPRLVAKRAFQNLAVGEAFSFSFDREWNAADEFQPSYRIAIVYDPDIRNDGNVKNDDCRMGNNVLDRAGTDINALFQK